MAHLEPLEPIPIAVDEHGHEYFPFDHLNPQLYEHYVSSLMVQFNARKGEDLPVRFQNTDKTRDVFVRFQRHDLYGMVVHTANHWNDPFILGDSSKGGNCGIGEGYGNMKVGYRAFEDAVNLLCKNLDREPTDDTPKEWKDNVAEAIYTICIMCIEAVRFPVLKYNFAEFLLKPRLESRYLNSAEDKLIHSWKKISRCAERDARPYKYVDYRQPITPELVEEAETYPPTAKVCLGIRHLPEGSARRSRN